MRQVRGTWAFRQRRNRKTGGAAEAAPPASSVAEVTLDALPVQTGGETPPLPTVPDPRRIAEPAVEVWWQTIRGAPDVLQQVEEALAQPLTEASRLSLFCGVRRMPKFPGKTELLARLA